jgi:hypothetical protein
MNEWAKVQYAIATVGTLAFGAVGLHGFRVAGDPDLLPLHTQLALAATLTLVLGHGWMILFTAASERRLRRQAGSGAAARALVRVRNRVGSAAGLALAVSLGHFALGGRLFATQVPGWIHGATALAAALLQVGALAVEARQLGRHQQAVARLAAATGPAPAC